MKTTAMIAIDYEVNQNKLLLLCPHSTSTDDSARIEATGITRFIPEIFLHHIHTSVGGGHQ